MSTLRAAALALIASHDGRYVGSAQPHCDCGDCTPFRALVGEADLPKDVVVARYHILLQSAQAVIDPEEHPQVVEAIVAALSECPPACSRPECEELGYTKALSDAVDAIRGACPGCRKLGVGVLPLGGLKCHTCGWAIAAVKALGVRP